MSLTLLADGLLALLLLATLVYVGRLNQRLGQLRAGRQEFEGLIARFAQATEQAERGLAAIRAVAAEEGQALQAAAERSRALRDDLGFLVDKANGLADQLEASIAQARGGGARARPTATDGRSAGRPARPAESGAASAPPAEEPDLLKSLASIR